MEPYLGEIRLASFTFAPQDWALCNGQLLPINQNQALFSILGTTYGGNGTTTFALPDLRGRVPMHAGQGFTLGEAGGEAAHLLLPSELPAHTHAARATTTAATTSDPSGALWATTSSPHYGTAAQVAMAPALVGAVGGSQPHTNMPPYLTLNFVIALVGVFPSRD